MSVLTCKGFGAIPAFSGSGFFIDNPDAVENKNNGPIPHGRYYITDRHSGGRLGFLKDTFKDLVAGTKRSDWLALYRDDDKIDDNTSVNGIIRGAFRIHPVGYWGISEGCITLPGVSDFYRLRTFLKSQIPSYINGMKYYGTVDVQ